MKITKPYFKIVTRISENALDEKKIVETAARTCYKSERYTKEDGSSAERMFKMLLEREHTAMIEFFPDIFVMITCDRGVANEIVRHRIASYAQESTRYVNYGRDVFGGEIKFIDIAGGIELDSTMKNMDAEKISKILDEWTKAMEEAEAHYMKMIELGCTPQIARGVLPLSTQTTLCMKMNLRAWRNFFKIRTPKDVHPQMREITLELLKEFKSKIPGAFDDIVP